MEDSKSPELLKKDFFLDCGFATRALHAGEHLGQPAHATNHTNAIFQTSTFVFQNAQEGRELFEGKRQGFIYSRLGNPTVLVLESKLNALEGKEYRLSHPAGRVSSVAFASGMAAVAAILLAACRQGDTVVCGDVLYGCSDELLAHQAPTLGIKVVPVDTTDLVAFKKVMQANPTARLVFFETPINPTMKITDIAAVARVAHEVNPDCLVAVDNTFSTPYLQRPLSLGADVVMHSTTKYLCGQGTVIGGLVCTSREDFKDKLFLYMKDFGPVPSPFDAWLVTQGVKTLSVRMDRHCSNAMAVARFLERHPKVATVAYPGLPSSPWHELASRQMSGFGGVIALELKGGYAAGQKLLDTVRIFTLAVSLGCVDSLIQHPASMTHAAVPEDRRLAGGITPGLVRLSIGLEDEKDLLDDLDRSLAEV